MEKGLSQADVARASQIGSQCGPTTRCAPENWTKEHISWTPKQWTSALFTDKSRFILDSNSRHLLIWWEQGSRYHQYNTVEKHSYRSGGIKVWTEVSLGGYTDLHVIHGGIPTGVRYRGELTDQYIHPHTTAIGNELILVDE
ncbi:uncharacterized protein TNCV_2649301 [Trichonephila clavipes]|nr:uncharacterized protein TNCV_2649301 [Trichonephila clavipes]